MGKGLLRNKTHEGRRWYDTQLLRMKFVQTARKYHATRETTLGMWLSLVAVVCLLLGTTNQDIKHPKRPSGSCRRWWLVYLQHGPPILPLPFHEIGEVQHGLMFTRAVPKLTN